MKEYAGLPKEKAQLAEILERSGLHHNISQTLVFIHTKDTTTSKDIQKATNLRQPEVSIAIQELRKNDWVDKKDYKKGKGKGRPIHKYSLSQDFGKVIDHFIKENKNKIKEIQADIKTLESMKKGVGKKKKK